MISSISTSPISENTSRSDKPASITSDPNPSSGGGLSAGAIVGIVIGIVVVIGIVGLLAFFLLRQRQKGEVLQQQLNTIVSSEYPTKYQPMAEVYESSGTPIHEMGYNYPKPPVYELGLSSDHSFSKSYINSPQS
jgi:hypothetical protein